MKNKIVHILLTVFLLAMITSCSTTKYIPDGKYLLDKVSLNTDSGSVSTVNLMQYIRQKPNDPKVGLRIYNMVNNDSNWFKKFIRKIGEPPVIYDGNLVDRSVDQLSIEMKNLGYLNAWVHAVVDTVGKKAEVDYHIHEGSPYRVRNYEIDFPQGRMYDIVHGIRRNNRDSLNSTSRPRRNIFRRNIQRDTTANAWQKRSFIKPESIFDMNTLDSEMQRVSSFLRNQGYYALSVNNLHYLADTTLRSNQVDLTMILKDSTLAKVYRIEKVKVFSGYDSAERENYRIVDSLENKGINIYYDSLKFLRPNVIADRILVRPGGVYRERQTDYTYSLFQSLNCVGRVDVEYKEGNYPDSTLLDCEIFLTPGNFHSIQTGVEGTNKAGDLGVALTIDYGHQNLFNGGELFNIRLRGAYEFVKGDNNDLLNDNYYELGITPTLTFPKIHLPPFIASYIHDRYNASTTYGVGLTMQNRKTFTRSFFNMNWTFQWEGRNRALNHKLSLIDINYIFMPRKSPEFVDYLENEVDSITKYSYENIFTAGLNYNLIYTNANSGRYRQHLYTIRFNFESSGNLLDLSFRALGAKKSESGQYKILGNPFAQYVKGDVDFSETMSLNAKSSLAFHVGLGVAYPYGNSSIMPFEKRYYAGGPNSVRGWSTRYLGPGSFRQTEADDKVNLTTHTGDINFIMSAEYRYKMIKWLEPAFFVDCGNIWTIKDYPNQPGGFFRWNSFYKELAVGTGVGLRFDLSFLILRIDGGTKVYDPARESGSRFAFLKGNFWKNSAVYLAIGYPF